MKHCAAAVLIVLLVVAVSPALASRTSLRRATTQAAAKDALWNTCGEEGGVVETGVAAVHARFGFGESWVEATLTSSASCSIEEFGEDPAPGIRKLCECSDEAVDQVAHPQREELGVNWERCASEGEECPCTTGVVRFGAAGRWVVAQLSESSTTRKCEASAFKNEDPSPGVPKECWCELADKSKNKTHSRVGIVLLTRQPPDFKTWVQYHLNYMGVERIFVQVEDTAIFQPSWDALDSAEQQRITRWDSSAQATQENRPKDDYETLQARQKHAMLEAKQQAAQMGLDWLFHIDDDELLYTPLHRPVGAVLASMPTSFQQAYVPNFEAVYPSPDDKDCFTEVTEVNMNVYAFVSYANGKAAVKVSADAAPAGPHLWRDTMGFELPSLHMDREPFGPPVMVLHYESCLVKRWEDKYNELGNTSPERIASIPFKFYRDSITRMQECKAEPSSPQCTQESLVDLWASYKTTNNPAIHPQDLMAVDIPWTIIQATK